MSQVIVEKTTNLSKNLFRRDLRTLPLAATSSVPAKCRGGCNPFYGRAHSRTDRLVDVLPYPKSRAARLPRRRVFHRPRGWHRRSPYRISQHETGLRVGAFAI